MLKFVKHHMESVLGIELYPLISLLVFFVFFVVMLTLVFKMSKKRVDILKSMPLEDDTVLEP